MAITLAPLAASPGGPLWDPQFAEDAELVHGIDPDVVLVPDVDNLRLIARRGHGACQRAQGRV